MTGPERTPISRRWQTLDTEDPKPPFRGIFTPEAPQAVEKDQVFVPQEIIDQARALRVGSLGESAADDRSPVVIRREIVQSVSIDPRALGLLSPEKLFELGAVEDIGFLSMEQVHEDTDYEDTSYDSLPAAPESRQRYNPASGVVHVGQTPLALLGGSPSESEYDEELVGTNEVDYPENVPTDNTPERRKFPRKTAKVAAVLGVLAVGVYVGPRFFPAIWNVGVTAGQEHEAFFSPAVIGDVVEEIIGGGK